jgi:hypothetical protein
MDLAAESIRVVGQALVERPLSAGHSLSGRNNP